MPTVPYNPIPTESPVSAPIPYRTDAGVSPTAFGANIGQAVRGLGQQIEKTSDTAEQDILSWQQLNNQSAAKDAAVDGAVAIGNRTTEFYKLEGQDAVKAKPQFDQDITQIRQNALQGLNPMARRMADQELARRIEFALIDAGRHTAQQGKVWADHASQAREGIALADTGRDPYNEQRFQDNLGSITAEVVNRAEQGGYLDSPQFKKELDDKFGKAWQERVTSIAQRDPIAAKDLYTKNMEQIKDPEVRASIERTLLTQMQNVGSNIRADQATSGEDYLKRVIQRESGGDPFAKAKTSSALGLGQFTDTTWSDLRRKHPELQLTPEGRTDPQQSISALTAFTADNRKALSDAGIDPNDKNAYMAHFLGAGGAISFIHAMEANPNAPALNAVTPSQVAANRSIFYDEAGRPKTTQEVYDNLTFKFGGPLTPLTGRSSGEWLEQARALGRSMAQHDMPDDPMYAEKIDNKIITRFNQATNAARVTDLANFNDLYSVVNGGGDPNKRVTDINVITQNPDLNRIYEHLPPAMQDRLYNRTIANSRQDNHETQENLNTTHSILGLAITDPEKFMNTDGSKLGLTFGQQDRIFNKQQAMAKQGLNNKDINNALNDPIVKGILRSQGWPPNKDDEGENARYNQFVGGLNEILEDHRGKKQESMTPDEYRKEAGRLAAIQSQSWWSGKTQKFDVPTAFKTEWHDRLTTKLGREPTEAEWGAFRQHYLIRSAQDAAK